MPTTYAHDLFGKIVYQKLNDEMKEIVLEHRTAYQIGLHGPDILFYVRPFQKNRVNGLGHRLHAENAAEFFLRGKQLYAKKRDPKLLAYLLGFACHFMLDSTCHPYISEYMKRTGAGHDEIETEFDRALMLATGKKPFHYYPASVIRIEPDCVRVIADVLGDVTEKDVRAALAGMRFYTGVTVCNRPWKRAWLLNLAKCSGIYPLVQGRIMRKHPVPRCEESTAKLKELFWLAIPETVTVLEEFYQGLDDPQEIGARFQRNYK